MCKHVSNPDHAKTYHQQPNDCTALALLGGLKRQLLVDAVTMSVDTLLP